MASSPPGLQHPIESKLRGILENITNKIGQDNNFKERIKTLIETITIMITKFKELQANNNNIAGLQEELQKQKDELNNITNQLASKEIELKDLRDAKDSLNGILTNIQKITDDIETATSNIQISPELSKQIDDLISELNLLDIVGRKPGVGFGGKKYRKSKRGGWVYTTTSSNKSKSNSNSSSNMTTSQTKKRKRRKNTK
jgi:FtsZ-binding cell division protein ZapB